MGNRRFLWEKTLIFLGLAFVLGFVVFSCAIVWSVVNEVKRDSESHINGVTAINEAKVKSMLSASYATVVDAAASFESLDRFPPAKRRKEGDAILTWMLNDVLIHNSWVDYEPDSLNGKAASHGGESRSASGGRYIRSYIRSDSKKENSIGTDTEEENERGTSGSVKSGEAFSALESISLHAYRAGEDHAASIKISIPIMHQGNSVGVVGGDVLVRDLVLARELNGEIVTAVFSPEEKLIFSHDRQHIGMTMAEMKFSRLEEIRKAMQEGREIFLQNEYSWLLDQDAFIYLKPLWLEDLGGEAVYLYAALPSSVVEETISTALRSIVVYLVVMLLAFVALFLFVVYHVTSPLSRLMQSINMVNATGTVQDLPYLKRRDEIGDLARSVTRLWQHFRMRLNYLGLAKIKLDSYLAIQSAIHKSLSFEEASKYILRQLRVSCNAETARFFIYLNGQARLFAISGMAGEFHIRSVELAPEFEGHEILAEALEGKYCLLMKHYAMRSLGLLFIAPKAWSVCVLPIRAGKELRAFVILETSDPRQVILHDDAVLNFISDRLADFFIRYAPVFDSETAPPSPETREDESATWAALAKSLRKEDRVDSEQEAVSPETEQQPVSALLPEEEGEASEIKKFLDAARSIPGLGVDKAFSMLGGNALLYMEMLSLSARELALGADKMREFLAAGDIHAFAIEVHGSKGVLNTIGAFYLGEQAHRLEMSAKQSDLEGCRLSYPHFEEGLLDFIKSLQTMLPKNEEFTRERRRLEDLLAGLRAVRAALDDYNLMLASDRLRHTMRFSYVAPGLKAEDIAEKLEVIAGCLERVEYEEAGEAVQELLACIGIQTGAGEIK